ncbi:integrase [Vibrio europaeus]|uniref:Integrase n=1 Tax=Vibrio europaeus TaxID=300876 RepID=A0A178J6P5_9VIBR|nr:integrase [Vibrio europaeus]MDC5706163.1 integrase [Vibrio europaeus]MDC5709573.1 integrase [Vibrio europaeus]MDC5713972.1 integrase [Vibrio europaeus]MDC5723419.1 integrase [Vibrio europaeus]MDC5730556.1 integrase [Vibrio europaeus]
MLVAIDNHAYLEELTSDIVNNPALLDGMHVETLSQLTLYAVEKDDFRALALLTEIHTGIPMNPDRLPNWWLSDFYNDVTKVQFEHEKKIKEIRWCDVILSDGKPLTSDKHQPLLNAFKNWLLACDDPINNGGKVISSKVAGVKSKHILTLINVILLSAKELNLSECHLEKVTDAFWLKVLLIIAESGASTIHDLYKTHSRVEKLLNNVDVSNDEVNAFAKKYPYAGCEINSEDCILNIDDRVKVCCWLHKHRYYAAGKNDKVGNGFPKGNNAILTRLIFEGAILTVGMKLETYPELALNPIPMHTEYCCVPNREKAEGVNATVLAVWLSDIKLINTNIVKNNVCNFNPVTHEVSVDAIKGVATLRKKGRTKTLPPEFVLDLFRDSYELLKQFCPEPNENGVSFWENTLELLTEAKAKSTKAYSNPHRPSPQAKAFDEAFHRNLPITELGHWLEFEAINLIHENFKMQGIAQFSNIGVTEENRHGRIRSNESMLELFTVLQGAVQLLLGSIMARRQEELRQLKPYGNLVYVDDKGKISTETDPYNEDIERWFLRFKVKKTGIKGNNLTADRPIPLSIARFVWLLEQFNLQAINRGVAKETDLTLFNHIHPKTFKLTKCDSEYFNAAFDALCDYFETATVEMESGEYHRHYIRQHQLRRFFALVFFWSKGYENMEALRWMLAHSDLEHLHNYITDNVDGAIIKSAKASTIVQSVVRDKALIDNLDELDKLRKILAKRLTGNASAVLKITTLDDAIFDYEDESEYRTIPHISQLQIEQELETEVLILLESHSITLEPEFFTVQDENGEDRRNFNLILKVNELEGDQWSMQKTNSKY